MQLSNYAADYAAQYGIPGQAITEDGWAFRVRIARTLEHQFRWVEAHEVLYNHDERENPYARGALSTIYGEAHMTEIARYVEAAYQATLRAEAQEHRRAARRAWVRHALRQPIAWTHTLRALGADVPWWLILGAIAGLVELSHRTP